MVQRVCGVKDESDSADEVEMPLDTANLADALESGRFKSFLDHVPFGVVVSELAPAERITYANLEFEHLAGLPAAGIVGKTWQKVPLLAASSADGVRLCDAITTGEDYLGAFRLQTAAAAAVDANVWSNIIQDDDETPLFRLVAIASKPKLDQAALLDLEQRLQEKDLLLRELQHRVKNNLQMITALIRLEARNLPEDAAAESLSRLAGRINALSLLYRLLSDNPASSQVDLGIYLSQIAGAVMQAHAVQGIRLDMMVDTWRVPVNVAMPAGLVVNELLTNALKHAFIGRDGGTVTLHSITGDGGCHVTVADDGIGMSDGAQWPNRGRLGALMVQSLEENARAKVEVETGPGKGTRVRIFFARAASAG